MIAWKKKVKLETFVILNQYLSSGWYTYEK